MLAGRNWSRGEDGAAPARPRLWIELVKDILMVALTVSAVLLTTQTPMFRRVQGWIAPPLPTPAVSVRQSENGAVPYLMCVRNSLGLYGISYDADLVGQTFDHLSPFLGEGLTTVGVPERVGQWQWQGLLESPGVYCRFQGTPPLSVLRVWLGREEMDAALPGNARAMILACSGGRVWLAWVDGDGAYYRARTEVAYEDGLESALEAYTPNGTAFAYTLADSDSTYAALDPFEPVFMTSPQPESWSVSSPDLVENQEALDELLKALGFRSTAGSAYESGGERTLNEGGDRLRVSAAGVVTFRAGEDVRYPVNGDGDALTAAQAARTAWDLLNRATAPWKGATAYILVGVEETTGGWIVTFQSRLCGIPVLTGAEGSCAVFTVGEKGVTDFTLFLRAYTSAGSGTLLPTQRLAAAALGSIAGSDGRLALCYQDTGGGTMDAVWQTGIP